MGSVESIASELAQGCVAINAILNDDDRVRSIENDVKLWKYLDFTDAEKLYKRILQYPFWFSDDVRGMKETFDIAEQVYGRASPSQQGILFALRASVMAQINYEISVVPYREECLKTQLTDKLIDVVVKTFVHHSCSGFVLDSACANLCTCECSYDRMMKVKLSYLETKLWCFLERRASGIVNAKKRLTEEGVIFSDSSLTVVVV